MIWRNFSCWAWRDRFRGSAAHNTIRVDGRNQAVSIPPFVWADLPAVRILKVEDGAAFYRIDGECAYSSFRHRRALIFARPDLIWILDVIGGTEGTHNIEQFWHPGEPVTALSGHTLVIGARAALTLDPGLTLETSEGGEHGWVSNRLLHKHPAFLLRASVSANLPRVCLSVIDLLPPFTAATVVAEQTDDGWILKYRGNREAQFYLRDFV